MFGRRMPRQRPGQNLSARQLDAPLDALEAHAKGFASAPGQTVWTPFGRHVRIDRPIGIWAQVSGASSPYSFTQQLRTLSGWATGPFSGTSNAYEVNGVSGLAGSFQWLTPGVGNEWLFQDVRFSGGHSTINVHVGACCGGWSGITVTLSLGMTTINTATTSAAGDVSFGSLSAGTYTISLSGFPAGIVCPVLSGGTSTPTQVVAAGTNTYTVSFGPSVDASHICCAGTTLGGHASDPCWCPKDCTARTLTLTDSGGGTCTLTYATGPPAGYPAAWSGQAGWFGTYNFSCAVGYNCVIGTGCVGPGTFSVPVFYMLQCPTAVSPWTLAQQFIGCLNAAVPGCTGFETLVVYPATSDCFNNNCFYGPIPANPAAGTCGQPMNMTFNFSAPPTPPPTAFYFTSATVVQ